MSKHSHHHCNTKTVYTGTSALTIALGVFIGGWALDRFTENRKKGMMVSINKRLEKIEKENKSIAETLDDILLCNF